jgi:hypothetical protein
MGANRVAKGHGTDLKGKTIMSRKSAVELRKERFGFANQMTHETEGRMQRRAILEEMAQGKQAAQRAHQKRVAQTTGMNSGTVGGIDRRTM